MMEALTQAHQNVMFQLLSEVDRICKKNNISYMLFAGTMLGAVRHQGFIPWDDDLDVIMLRPEYERFLKIAQSELEADSFFLQKEFSPHWPMFFSKLRRNGTACIERYIPKDPEQHQGVYIDIFPCDNLYGNKFLRKAQFLASKVVIAKSLDARGYLTDSLRKKLFILCCKLIPRKPLVFFAQHIGKNDSKMVHSFFSASSKYEKNVFPREWFTETVNIPFEKGSFPVSTHYDELLTQLYGDYMVPAPPESRGCKVHGEIVDLDHSYEDYIGIQKTLQFKEYTRSIR